ncbi:Protein of unknown function, partial [Gryllus bimaculatus]
GVRMLEPDISVFPFSFLSFVGRLTNDWKMAGTFRSDYIVRQRNYHPNNTADMTNDIFFGAGDSGGNQLLVNIQNEYAMHPAPGARRTWPRSRGLRRNQFLGISNRRPQVDLAAGGDATASAAESLNSVRQTVALHGSTRNTAHNGLPRKMTESPAQLVPTLVVEQNVVENMGQPSASTTRMTLSERFSKRHTTSDDSEALYAQVTYETNLYVLYSSFVSLEKVKLIFILKKTNVLFGYV